MNKFNSGLSLLEIVIAMGVLAAIIIPVFAIFSASSSNLDMTETDFRAHNAAIELMEQVIGLPFKYLKAGSYTANEIKNGLSIADSEILYEISGEHEAELFIEDIRDEKRIAFKKVGVRINYFSHRAQTHKKSFEINTLVANEAN